MPRRIRLHLPTQSSRPVLTIFAISGSLRPQSSNGTILRFLATAVPPGTTFHIYPDLGALPHFMPGEDAPPVVEDFRQQIRAADAVLFCTPEYAHGMPGVLKNALDWTVSSGDFYEKPVAVITASSQGQHGHASLLQTLQVLTAQLIPDASLIISFIRSKIDAEGRIAPEVQEPLNGVLGAIHGYLSSL